MATTFYVVWQFYKASNRSVWVLALLVGWMIVQSLLSLNGFYLNTTSLPPRFLLALGPPVVLIICLHSVKFGKRFLETLKIEQLTLLSIVRIPVEIVLYFLFIRGLVPEMMTFEGLNFDILSGLSAPILYYLVFISKKLGTRALLIWNFICLALLVNIVTIAILSAKTPLQVLAFDQPNIGVTIFPFIWLPSIVVPIVFTSHLASIRQLLKSKLL